MESTARLGLSKRRKPSTTPPITEINKGSSDSEPEAQEQAPSSSSKMEHNHDSEPQNNDMETDVAQNDESLSRIEDNIPEGTVLVVPEAVNKINSPFKGPEFKKIYDKLKAEGNVDEMIICCTSCSTQVNHKMTGMVFVHPLLNVLLCRKCKNFYNSGGFATDENGIDEYCRWCAEGGDLLCCDSCTHAFCKACIRRNFGRSELSKISKLEEWQCLICDPSPLLELQATCLLVLNYTKKESERKSEKGLSQSKALFSSPSMKIGHKEAIEICMENSVQAGRLLRDGVAVLRKKLMNANEPNVYAARVGKKLKKFLQVTKENLDSVERAVDRELAKMPPNEQSNKSSTNDKESRVKLTSSEKDTKLADPVQTKNKKMERLDDVNVDAQPINPEAETLKPFKTGISRQTSSESSKCDVDVIEKTINGNELLPEKICKDVPLQEQLNGSQQDPENEGQLVSAKPSCDDESDLENIEGDAEDADVTVENILESELVENITPNDDDSKSLQEDADDIIHPIQDESTFLINDTTTHVTPLKNNDSNKKTESKKSKIVVKSDEIDGPSKGLKIVLKKLPATNDLDKEIVKKVKSEKKRVKGHNRKEKDKIDGKSSKKGEKKATSAPAKDLLENSNFEDGDTDLDKTVLYQIESKITDKPEDFNDFNNKSNASEDSVESNSTLIADVDVPATTCDSPTSNSDDGKLLDAKVKKHSRSSDEPSDAETIPGSFSSDYKNHLSKKSKMEDAADASSSDSGHDAAMGGDSCHDSGSDSDANNRDIIANDMTTGECEDSYVDAPKDDNYSKAEQGKVEEEGASSECEAQQEADEENNGDGHSTTSGVKRCLFSDISDGEEQETTQVKSKETRRKISQKNTNRSKTNAGLEAGDSSDNCLDVDKNAAAVFNGLPNDENKVAKKNLLNRLFDNSDEEADDCLDKKPKTKLSRDEKDHVVPNLASVESNSEDALAKKKLLSCLDSDSDDDDENRTGLSATTSGTGRRNSSIQEIGGSPTNSSPSRRRIPKPKSARSVHESSSASSLSSDEERASDEEVALPKTKAARKIIKIADVEKFINEDPKLKQNVTVVIQPLKPGVMKQLATFGVVLVKRRQKAVLGEAEALDRDISRLCNLKSLRMKKRKKPESDSDCSCSTNNKTLQGCDRDGNTDSKDKTPVNNLKEKKIIPEKKKSKKDGLTSLFTSSSEDEEPDLDDLAAVDKRKKFMKSDDENDKDTISMNKRAKAMLSELLTMSSDEQNSDADDSDTTKKSKNKKKERDGKKKNSDDESQKDSSDGGDDSDDFTPFKKNKRFTSKLLRARLSDSDESYKASSDSRGAKKRKKRSTASNSKGSNSSGSGDDSSDDVTSPVKPRKRRTRGNAKSSSSTDGDSLSNTKKKKRRRIKTMSGSSDSDCKVLDDKNGTPSGKGRKNIRRVIRDTKLRDDTKFAAREEEERRNRVAELQKQYNVVVVDAGKDGAPITKKLVLEKDPKTKEALVEVHPELISKLKPHQVDGVKFLWESMCESLERLQTHHGSGCILAHCMGLGKTLQVITFLHTLLSNENTYVKTALVVCPLNTVVNWYMEFRNWLDEIDPPLEQVIELSSVKSNYERARAMKNWTKNGGVMIIGYEMFRNLVQEKGKRMPKSCRETFQNSLINPGPDVVVCDEGHLLKNSATSLSKSMSRVGTRRRVVLTGTPLQNNLAEYHCMVDFVKPSLLGTMKEFKNRFVNPIQNGQCADSTSQDVRIMKRRAHILHNLLDGCVQRRDYNVLTPFLPQKHEYVISIRLTDIQVKLYVYYLENLARKSTKSASLFSDYQQLMRIWTHPRVIRLAEIRQENKIRLKQDNPKNRTAKCMSVPNGQRPTYDDSENSFIDDGSTESESDSNVVCIDNDEEPSTSKGRKQGDGTSDDEVVNNWKSRSRGGRQNEGDGDADKIEAVIQSNNWWTEFISEEDAKKFEHSGKMILLFSILKECYNIGDKLLLFSQSLLSLDLIETLLQESQEFNEDGTENPLYAGKWISGLDYFRLDGSTSADARSRYTGIFNDTENLTARLFLISTRAGSLGINLVAANRVIVFDASWNPSHDVQSIFRVYRFGQEKPVYVYRFLAQGTMEEKIYDRQVTKQSLACRVVDEQQIERHFNFSDLQELYTFTPERVNKRATPKLPKDRLLAELLMKKKDLIVSYHEHDSLLVNQAAEELSEEERKAAWVEYEVERKGMMDASGQQMSQGLYGIKLDIASIIHGIQEKEPGLSVTELTGKLHETIAAIHQARRVALEQQRQEILRVQMQNQQREMMVAQQKRDVMAQVQQRIAHGDLTPEQIAWYSQVMGPDQSQLSKLLLQPNSYVPSGNSSANLKPSSNMLSNLMENFKNATKK